MANNRYTWRNLITLIGVIIIGLLVWSMVSTLSKKDYNNLGLEQYQRKNYKKAIEYYTKAIEADHDNAKAYHNRGLAHFKQGGWKHTEPFEKAISDYTRAIELNTNYIDAHYNRGLVYEQFIHYTAKPFSGDAIEKYNKALADFDKALELDPMYVLAYAGKGNILYRYGEFEKATEAYNKALESENLIVEKVGKRGLAGVYASRGRNYKQYLKMNESLADYSKALDLAPKLMGAIGNQVENYMTIQDYARAVELSDRAVDILENDPEYRDYEWGYGTYFSRGVALYELHQYDRAIAGFKKVLATKKMDDVANKYLCLCYGATGNMEKAKDAYDKVVPKLSKTIDKGKARANTYLDRALCHYAMKEYDLAILDLGKVIELKPEYKPPQPNDLYIEAHYYLGLVYAKMGDKEKARRYFENTISLAREAKIDLSRKVAVIEELITRL